MIVYGIMMGKWAAAMHYGRLIRVGRFRGDPNGTAYIVAVAEPAKAIDLIRDKVASSSDEIEDLGRVSDALLIALKLKTGDFVRA
jgi:hypothetical protein